MPLSAALAAAVAVAVAVVPLASARADATEGKPLRAGGIERASVPMRFDDQTGDSGSAPDLNRIDVANDVLARRVVVWIETSNRTELRSTDVYTLFLDTDRNPATGSPGAGADHAVTVDGAARRVVLLRWTGSAFEPGESPSLAAEYVVSERALRISIVAADIGGTQGFNFFVSARAGGQEDLAPNAPQLWSYTLTFERLRLRASRIVLSRARAGRLFVAGLLAVRSDLNETVAQGRVTCSLRVGSKRLRTVARRFVDDVATCGWRLPRTAAGKRVRGTITVRFAGARATRSFTTRVR